MPPKKPEKKDDKSKDNSDPVPKNECAFNIEFEIFHEKGHFVKLKYNWINKDTLEQDKLETDYVKDWVVIRKEGVEGQAEVAEPVKDDKKKPPAKDPKKAQVMEEINDSTPTVVKYNKSFEEFPLKVTEEVANKWSKMIMKIDVYEYNREANEDRLKDSTELDLSFFLFPQTPVSSEWEFEKLKLY